MTDHEHVTEPDREDEITVMGRIAKRLRMTEGQLYTAVLLVLSALLLSLTGLPTAERTPSTDPGVPTLSPVPSEESP
jgi:hypothetical protein